MQNLCGGGLEGSPRGLRQPCAHLLTQPLPPPPPGSPLQFYVDAINSRHECLRTRPEPWHGQQAATFTIVTKDAGEGEGSYRRGWGRAAGAGEDRA